MLKRNIFRDMIHRSSRLNQFTIERIWGQLVKQLGATGETRCRTKLAAAAFWILRKCSASAQRSLRLTECSVGRAESAEKVKVISLPEFEDAETMFRIASLSMGRVCV